MCTGLPSKNHRHRIVGMLALLKSAGLYDVYNSGDYRLYLNTDLYLNLLIL